MKIALVILHANPTRGGAERYTADLAGALAVRGHDVSILASSFGPAINGVQFCTIESRGPTRLSRYMHFFDSLDSNLKENQYDVVHAMLPVGTCDLYHPHAGLAAEAIEIGHRKYTGKLRQSIAKIANRLNRKRNRFAAIERGLLESVNPPMVLCLSEHMRNSVRMWYPKLNDRQMVKLFNAVDLDRFDPAKNENAGEAIRKRFHITNENVVGLMIAQDFERKGLREAILGLARVDDSRMVLLVVGKQDPAVYRHLAQSNGLQDRVFFVGPTDDPYSFYKAADFFILPTRHDPCSLVVLESLAMGVPVISTVFNGACEIMENRIHGFVLQEADDVKLVATAMNEMIDATARAAMSQACLNLRSALAYDRHVETVEGFYQGILTGKNSSE